MNPINIVISDTIKTSLAMQIANASRGDLDADMNIRVNSTGGDVQAAIDICNTLSAHRGFVTVRVDYLCASAATFLCCYADKVKAAANAVFMVHWPWTNVQGSASTLMAEARILKGFENKVLGIYSKKIAFSTVELAKILNRGDAWLTSDQARQWGLVDEVTPDNGASVKFMEAFNQNYGSLEDRATCVWAKSSSLRQRYPTLESFVNFCRAQAASITH